MGLGDSVSTGRIVSIVNNFNVHRSLQKFKYYY